MVTFDDAVMLNAAMSFDWTAITIELPIVTPLPFGTQVVEVAKAKSDFPESTYVPRAALAKNRMIASSFIDRI